MTHSTRWKCAVLGIALLTFAQHAAPAPTVRLSGSPATTTAVNQPYFFKPTLINGDPRITKFYITGRPGWASFNYSNGTLSGTPTTTGTWSNIKVMSFDGSQGAALPLFSLTVQSGTSTAVKISGTPSAKADVGAFYSFRPTVSAPAGAKLTYSISNKPSWAAFSTSNGSLSGTPATGNIATYSNIGIRVTDSKTSASLPAFSVAVAKAGTGAALLSWSKPTKNTDGSALLNLAGYRIHYGNSLSALSRQLTVSGSSTTSASIEGLSRGTWYFAIAAFTTAGLESSLSGAASKIVN